MPESIEIVEAVNPLDLWEEVEPLYRALHQYHQPIRGFTLQPGWEAAQQSVLTGAAGGNLVLLARSGQRAVGVLDGAIRDNPITGTRSGFVNNAYVQPELRALGIGRTLLDHFEVWAREQGAADLRLSVDSENVVAVEAWRSLGFETVAYTMARELA